MATLASAGTRAGQLATGKTVKQAPIRGYVPIAKNKEEAARRDQWLRAKQAREMAGAPKTFTYQADWDAENKKYTDAQKMQAEQQKTMAVQKKAMSPWESLYGQNFGQTGRDIQGVKNRTRAASEGTSPAQNQARAYHNQLLAQATERGASPAEVAALERQGAAQFANLDWQSQMQGLEQYRSVLGNILRGQMMGYLGSRQLGIADKAPVIPEQEPDFLGKLWDTVTNWIPGT